MLSCEQSPAGRGDALRILPGAVYHRRSIGLGHARADDRLWNARGFVAWIYKTIFGGTLKNISDYLDLLKKKLDDSIQKEDRELEEINRLIAELPEEEQKLMEKFVNFLLGKR